MLAGLLFPLLITLAWGWRYGLLSALAGGCQSMWWLWRGDGWGFLYAVPVFTLWIVWHGWWADRRSTSQNQPIYKSVFLIEIPFRIVIELGFYTVFRWLVSFNPPPWNPSITWNLVPLSWVHTVAVKHTITAYLLLLVAYVMLRIGPVRRFFGLPCRKEQRSEHLIYASSVLMGIFVWFVDTIIHYFIFREGTFWELLIYDVSGREMYIRLLLFSSFIVFGVIVGRLVRHRTILSERNDHLNKVLLAIRNVNQLITKEKDRNRLLDSVCSLLIETKGYFNVWICLLENGKPVEPFFHAGFNGGFGPMTDMLLAGELPVCVRRALQADTIQITHDPEETCNTRV